MKYLLLLVLAACTRTTAPRDCIAVRHPNGNPDWHPDTTFIHCQK